LVRTAKISTIIIIVVSNGTAAVNFQAASVHNGRVAEQGSPCMTSHVAR